MKSRLKDISLAVVTLIALIAKGCWIGVGWPEAIAIPLILAIHYGRAFMPKPFTELTQEQIHKLLREVYELKIELTKMKLRVGFSPELRKK
jgi:hypothetical protein